MLSVKAAFVGIMVAFDEEGNVVSEEVVFSAGPQEGQFVDMRCPVRQS